MQKFQGQVPKQIKSEPTWLEINCHFTWSSNFSIRNSEMMKNPGGFSKMCDPPGRKETLCQEIKCGLLDFSKMNIPVLIQPNKLKQYSWRSSCCKSQQTFGIPFLKSGPKLISTFFWVPLEKLDFIYEMRNSCRSQLSWVS